MAARLLLLLLLHLGKNKKQRGSKYIKLQKVWRRR